MSPPVTDLSASPGVAVPSARRVAIPPLWLLALLTFTGTMAMHVFVPALPDAAASLGAEGGVMALTISFYILGLAVGQLVYGPVSDRFGRRPVLMFGLVVYIAASLLAYLAPNVETLVTARLLQALGGCAGLVLGRAIVRDCSAEGEATRRLALMNLMVAIGPGIAPLIGVGLVHVTGWRSIFLAMTVLGIVNAILALRLLPETGGGRARSAGEVARDYARLIRSPVFLGYAIGGGCATTSLYAFITVAPFVFVHDLGVSTGAVGAYLALNILGFWFGSLATSRLVRVLPTGRMLVFGNLISVAAAVAFLVLVLTDRLTVAGTVFPMMIFTFGAGISSPAALTLAMSLNANAVGSASGLYGFSQMVIGAICTSLVGLGGEPALSAGIVLTASGVLAQAAFWMARRRASIRGLPDQAATARTGPIRAAAAPHVATCPPPATNAPQGSGPSPQV